MTWQEQVHEDDVLTVLIDDLWCACPYLTLKTYYSVKRDLVQSHKRPVTVSKDPYLNPKPQTLPLTISLYTLLP